VTGARGDKPADVKPTEVVAVASESQVLILPAAGKP